jgi:hypothetical protein
LAALRREEAVERAVAAREKIMQKYKMVRFFGTSPPPTFELTVERLMRGQRRRRRRGG